jgi:Tfp pilus assembly protein PilF
MSRDYEAGRRDGLRLALAIVAAEEEKWALLLGESRSWRTNKDRAVRHKALQVAQRRIQTALNRLAPGDPGASDAELEAALRKVGL